MASSSAAPILLLELAAAVLLVLQRVAAADAVVTTFPGDAAALASLKSAVDAATVPAYSCLASWDFARDPCAAFPCGVRCYAPPNSSSYHRVTGVSLDPAGYSGTLPATVLASLPFLAFLSLASNRFHGALPAGSPLPPSLRVLDLSGNAFSGEIRALSGSLLDAPGRLPGSLVSVVARGNGFAGPLQAAALAALPAMRVLDLTGNAVSGAVPGAAFAHPSLQQLRLGSNKLGAVEEAPDGGASSQLVELDLGGNRLTGRLPGCVAAMPRLAVVGLDRNMFAGGIPDQYAARAAADGPTDKWVPFVRLMLQGNFLCGALPSQLRQLKEDGAVVEETV
ncbi:hypothetical protein OsJ_07719 [Oryza sativa Japonica Group]|uniref:Leucine-rich repeat-containing N-terminal plant-type domain-containing protein n=1 Tax=Oryza sativa subsp. japonica TaxID=39947 RepID=A3A9K7_ORYSJ|nr:hypothetical protein OsJ_07719 [Oryza sativa Japonica Group]